ncbi:hypothetical protein T10_3109 [Trichinella papuae]|uniref:Uncharacterized protein n=1 Tax=Trichinella papuae TaxID=268474 RepID=A0A0V1N4K5_9BILA|nr:hypothetical protein T10_3109 [Trichinella papuae]
MYIRSRRLWRAIAAKETNECYLDVRSNIVVDGVLPHQNRRRLHRKLDKHHYFYSKRPITCCNSSKNVSPNDGKLTIFVKSSLETASCSYSTPGIKNGAKKK